MADDDSVNEWVGSLYGTTQKEQDNGPERWHDALTKYTELEVRIARLEHTVYVLEHELANFMGRFANKA